MDGLPPRVTAMLDCVVTGARRGGAHWDEIRAGARACGVGPTLLAALSTGKIDPEKCGTTAPEVERLRSEYSVHQAVKMRLLEHTADCVCGALDSAEIRWILLKGGPMSARLMNNALYRDSNDVDIWVCGADRARAESVLSEKGYVRAVEPHEWASNQVLLGHEVLAPVEIHWALAPPPLCAPSFESCYGRSERAPGRAARVVLETADLWVHLLLHAMEHLFALKTVLDLAAFCDTADVDRKKLHLRASACGLGDLSAAVYDAVMRFDDAPVREWGRGGIHAKVLGLWIRDMFLRGHGRGHLVIGENSGMEAARGVLMRACSMLMLDGTGYSVRAALGVLFFGPHRIGALGAGIRKAGGRFFHSP